MGLCIKGFPHFEIFAETMDIPRDMEKEEILGDIIHGNGSNVDFLLSELGDYRIPEEGHYHHGLGDRTMEKEGHYHGDFVDYRSWRKETMMMDPVTERRRELLKSLDRAKLKQRDEA